MESITITLAGADYEIKELTLGQLEDIQAALTNATGTLPNRRNREIIAIALSEDHPDLTSEKLRKLRLGSIKNVESMMDKIFKFAGYEMKSPEKQTGEGLAGA